MRDRRLKPLAGALAVAVLGALASGGSTRAADAGHEAVAEARDYWVDTFGPAVAVEAGEDLALRLAHFQRYEALHEVFAQALAKEAGLKSPRLWELHPDVLFFRTILTQTALNGEASCEDSRNCAVSEATGPAGSFGQTCERQHVEAVSACGAILTSRCRGVAERLCRKLRRQAYRLCTEVASCQLECCLGYCCGTHCATWAANGRTGTKCANCAAVPTPAAPPGQRR